MDLTELADCPIRRGDDREELEVELCEGVVLRIIV
jgi:hypothetical protein